MCRVPFIHLVSLLLIALNCSVANAQLISINTQVSIMPGTLVSAVGGNVLVQNDGTITNEGEFHIQGDFQNEGETQAYDESLFMVKGDWINNADFTAIGGEVVVKGNWINNDDFVALGGEVILDSANQFIMGTEVSNFYHLTLINGIKTQTIDATAFLLTMEDTHLATSVYDFEITSTDADAIETDGSWVSSEEGGQLFRNTNSYDDYLYPVGSPYNEGRYRPVIVSPKNASPNKVGIRMVNHQASSDGFDIAAKGGEISQVNPLYYHLIEHIEGESSFDLTFQYATDDIDAETVAHWNTNWEYQFNTSGGYGTGTITALNVSDFTTEAFALAALNPIVHIPNAFTPDADGINDTFFMVCDDYSDIEKFEFKIFNRWGDSIFETTDPRFHWTGGNEYYASDGAYSWIMTYNPEGAEEPKQLKGHLIILR